MTKAKRYNSLDAYSENEFQESLKGQLRSIMIKPQLSPLKHPRAFLLGGQSGAGKTTLHHIIGEELEQNVAVINGDEYRRLHPNAQAIQEKYDKDAPAHTAKWSGAMTEALIDALSLQRYNLIIEGTLRTSEVPLRTAKLLQERGYAAELAIMAVKPEISLLSCQIRYEMMRIAGTAPRATDPAHHNKIVQGIANNLSTLEESGAFERVRLFNRAGTCLYPSDATSGETASDVLKTALFGPWNDEEAIHRSALEAQLARLRENAVVK